METASLAIKRIIPKGLANALIQAIKQNVPFDKMAPAELNLLLQHARLAFYPEEKNILTPEDGPSEFLYLIQQGTVHREKNQDPTMGQNVAVRTILTAGEFFSVGSLLRDRPSSSLYRAKTPTFCYQIPKAVVIELIQKSQPFKRFCDERLSTLLIESRKMLQARYAHLHAVDSLEVPLKNVIKKKPITCSPDTSIEQVIEILQCEKISAILIVNELFHLIGIFTLHDVLDKIALSDIALDEPIASVMTKNNLTVLDAEMLACEAIVMMTQKNIQHIPVVESKTSQKLIGVISEKDLFSLQQISLNEVSDAMHRARDIEQLVQANNGVYQLARNMIGQGIAAEQITQFISILHDLLFERALIIAKKIHTVDLSEEVKSLHYAILGLGTHGRFENTLYPEQQHILVFKPINRIENTQVREEILPVLKTWVDILEQCGFRIEGTAQLSSQPDKCLTLDEWKAYFLKLFTNEGHLDEKLYAEQLNGMLHQFCDILDARFISGEPELVNDFKHWIKDTVNFHPMFIKRLIEHGLNIQSFGEKLTFWLSEQLGGVDFPVEDLVRQGKMPFISAARIYALMGNNLQTQTSQRLQTASQQFDLHETEVASWCEAFGFLQQLALRASIAETQMTISDLNDLDQRILRESLRQAERLQTRLANDYIKK